MRATVLLALAAFLAACGVKEEVYKAKELEAQKNLKMYQDESQKSADLEKKLAAVQARLGDLEKQYGVVAGSKEQLEREKGQLVAESLGAEVVGVAFVIELEFLGGRAKLPGRRVHALVRY